MKITAVRAFQVDLPLVEGRYTWSDGRYVEVFDDTVVEIQTDAGISGYAESCPLGSAYLPAHALGVRAGLAELAPHLIGRDPRDLNEINRAMDAALLGHPHAKAPVDIACWDIAGKATGLPLYTLLGGRAQQDVALYRAISQLPPDEMAANVAKYRAEGYGRFQLKVGGDPNDDIARIRAARRILSDEDCWWPTPTPVGRDMKPPGWSARWRIWTCTSSNPAPPSPSASPSAGVPPGRSCLTRPSTDWRL